MDCKLCRNPAAKLLADTALMRGDTSREIAAMLTANGLKVSHATVSHHAAHSGLVIPDQPRGRYAHANRHSVVLAAATKDARARNLELELMESSVEAAASTLEALRGELELAKSDEGRVGELKPLQEAVTAAERAFRFARIERDAATLPTAERAKFVANAMLTLDAAIAARMMASMSEATAPRLQAPPLMDFLK